LNKNGVRANEVGAALMNALKVVSCHCKCQ
jgi:hypothetical protein